MLREASALTRSRGRGSAASDSARWSSGQWLGAVTFGRASGQGFARWGDGGLIEVVGAPIERVPGQTVTGQSLRQPPARSCHEPSGPREGQCPFMR